MYRVSKRMEISAMHHLDLDYESPCTNNHGHNWIITVVVSGQKLNSSGMLLDFKHIKQIIHDKLDHKNLNVVFEFNPTAENIAGWVRDEVDSFLIRNAIGRYTKCVKVTVQESEGNIAEWSID